MRFEMLHLFGDCNGRTGRILYNNYFITQCLTDKLVMNMSGVIELKKEIYYNCLKEEDYKKLTINFIESYVASLLANLMNNIEEDKD